MFRGLRWRSIGPARGGRSQAVAGSASRPLEYYFGATGGGLWKTTDGGVTWRPVSDRFFTSSSVGAVAVSESNPDVVYVGMGETELRGNILQGDGVDARPPVGASGNVATLDPLSGQPGPSLASLGARIETLRVADTTRDGSPDLHAIVGRHLVVYDLAQGLVAWTSPFLGRRSGEYDTLWIGNFDADAAPELAVNIQSGFAIFESPLFALFADGFESGDTSAWSGVVP